MQRPTIGNTRMLRWQLATEIDPFLDVRLARGQLLADREVTAPSRPTLGHGDSHLGLLRQGEEAAADRPQLSQQGRRNPVAGQEEEAVTPASRANGLRHRLLRRHVLRLKQRRHIDDRQRVLAHDNVSKHAGSLVWWF